MDITQTTLDITVAHDGKSVFVVHRAGDADALAAFEWSIYGVNTDILVAVEGYRSQAFKGWDDEEWPFAMNLTERDFADKRSRMFVHSFKSRIRPTLFTRPRLCAAILEELGPINDYLITYDDETARYGLRLREITKEQQPFWFMAKLAR